MVYLKNILLLVLINTSYSFDAIKSGFTHFLATEIPITSPTEYAQGCFQTGDFPILSDLPTDSPISEKSIPLGQLTTKWEAPEFESPITLAKSKGPKRVKCSVVSLEISHYNAAAKYLQTYPLHILGTYTALYFLPSMISTPIVTTAFAAGAGYFFWQNRNNFPTIDQSLDGLVRATGLKTTVGQALKTLKDKKIEPKFKSDGNLHFQAYIPNGMIPGQYIHIDMEVTPQSESK